MVRLGFEGGTPIITDRQAVVATTGLVVYGAVTKDPISTGAFGVALAILELWRR